jgi:hypothetical protein
LPFDFYGKINKPETRQAGDAMTSSGIHSIQGTRSMSTLTPRGTLIATFVVGLALAACTASPSSPPKATAQSLLGMSDAAPVDSSLGERDLTPPEKKIISDAVSLSIKDPNGAKFRWTKFTNTVEGSANYCGSVDAKSPYPAYNGRQNFIVEAQVTGGKISSAVVGLIAGGKDAAIVTKMCAKYGLNPDNAS